MMNLHFIVSLLLGVFLGGGIAFVITVKLVLHKTKEGSQYLQDKDFGADIEIEPMTIDDVEVFNDLKKKNRSMNWRIF